MSDMSALTLGNRPWYDPFERQIQELTRLIGTQKGVLSELDGYSVYHIKGVIWLKYMPREGFSQDRKLGRYEDAYGEITVLIDQIMKIKTNTFPPMAFDMKMLNEDALKELTDWEEGDN
jgi:hypothetical protein